VKTAVGAALRVKDAGGYSRNGTVIEEFFYAIYHGNLDEIFVFS
jgi:hypothetical protein